jgi:NarL family two-component system response regulator LiaR
MDDQKLSDAPLQPPSHARLSIRNDVSVAASGAMDRDTPSRLLIVDDHELARAGLLSLLSQERGLEVVGQAASGEHAVALCHRLRPDLVLMDLRILGMDGLEATRAIKRELSGITVIIITMHDDPEFLFEALKAGAAGYVLKGATRSELLTAVRAVLNGECVLHPGLAAHLLRRMAGETRAGAPLPMEQLTPRECEVLRLVAGGHTNGRIARELHVSVSTAKAHVQHIIGKLGVSDRTQAAVRAVELHLLQPASQYPQTNLVRL